jgi:Family of unknown function (DUF6174)
LFVRLAAPSATNFAEHRRLRKRRALSAPYARNPQAGLAQERWSDYTPLTGPYAVLAGGMTAAAQVPSLEADLAFAEAKWLGNKPATYEFTLKILCFCAPAPPGFEPIVFRVNNGVGALLTGSRMASVLGISSSDEKYSTVEKQFAFIRASLSERPYRVEIEYDSVLGYPRRVYIDPEQITHDEEYGFRIEAFSVLPR